MRQKHLSSSFSFSSFHLRVIWLLVACFFFYCESSFAAGSVSGKIVDAADGTTPISQVWVALIDPVTGEDTNVGGLNNPDGTYLISDVAPGDYKVHFNSLDEANVYVDELYNEIPCDQGGCGMDALGDIITISDANYPLDEDLIKAPIISGKVTADGGATPLEGIRMTVSRKSDGARLESRTTDINGNYSFTITEPRDDLVVWTRIVSPQPYFAEAYLDQTCAGSACTLDEVLLGTSIDVTTGSKVADMSLAKSASISGTISRSVPAGSVGNYEGRARLYRQSDPTTLVAIGFTDADGNYLINGIEPGAYHLMLGGYNNNLIDELYDNADGIYCPRMTCDTTPGHVFNITGTEDISNINATLDSGTQFSGHVSENGTPLNNIWINFYTESGLTVGYGRTANDGSGNYVTTFGLPPGNYRAANRWVIDGVDQPGNEAYLATAYPDTPCGTPCDVAAGSLLVSPGTATIVPNIDFAFEEEPATLSGRVSNAVGGGHLGSVWVALIDPVGGDDTGMGGMSSNFDGTYLIENVPPGDYKVYFNALDGSSAFVDELYDEIPCDNGGCDMASVGTVITLASGTNTLDEDLNPGTFISGHITGSDTSQPLTNILLWLFDLQCNYKALAVTDSNGYYQMPVSEAGDYYLFAIANEAWFSDRQSAYINQQYPGLNIHDSCYPPVNDVTQGEAIAVAEFQQVTGKDFVLDPGGIIRGTISDSNGVLPNDSAAARLFSMDGVQQVAAANYEGDGSYRMGGVKPGTYQMVLSAFSLGLIDERWADEPCPRNSCDPVLGDLIEIVTGTEVFTEVDAILEPGAVIRGNLTDRSSGLPLGGQCVYIYTEAGVYAINACSDASGNFETGTGLPVGTYRMSNQLAFPTHRPVSNGYVPQVWTNDDSFLSCGSECDFTLGDTFAVNGTSPVENIDMAMLTSLTISGTVTADIGAAPLEGIRMTVSRKSDGVRLHNTFTDSNGFYEFTLSEPRDDLVVWTRTVSPQPYFPEIYQDQSCTDWFCDVDEIVLGTSIDITTGSKVVDMSLAKSASVSGTISRSVPAGLLGRGEGRARIYRQGETDLVAVAFTDANGYYLLGALDPGNYYLRLSGFNNNLIDELYDDANGIYCPELFCDKSTARIFTITGTEDVINIDATLDAGTQFSGHVSENGAPLNNIFINFYAETGELVGNGRTSNDGSGNYVTSAGYPAGNYRAANRWIRNGEPQPGNDQYIATAYPNTPCGTPCDVTAGDIFVAPGTATTVSGIDFKFYAADAGTAVIYGTVTADDGGAPLNDVKVCVVNKNDNQVDACEITDSLGTYLIGNLAPTNDYVVYTKDVGGQAFFGEVHDSLDCCDTSAGTSVDLTSSDAMINFGLAASGRIHGTVTDSVTGEGISNVEMILYDADGNQVNNIISETTDDQAYLGQYAISGVPDGTFYVFAQSEWQGYVNELYPDLKRFRAWIYGPVTDGQAIVISNGTLVDGIDFELDPAGTINGTVSDSNGVLPFNKARVRLYHPGQRILTLLQVGNWNNDNTYTIPGVPPGTYDVLLTTVGTTLIGERFDDITCPRNSCDSGLGTRVVVGPAEEVTGINAELEEGAMIAGIITDAKALQGVGGFCLGFYTLEGEYAAFACTDQDGNYGTTTGLPPGEYRAANQIFTNEIVGGYLPQVWTDNGEFVNCGVPCNVLLGDTFTVTGTTVSGAVNMAMEKGSTIAGTVQFGGNPLESVDVVLMNEFGALVKTVQTDAAGNFLFGGLSSGDFYIRTLNSLGYQDRLHRVSTDVVCDPDCNPFSGTLVVLGPSSDLGGFDFSLTVAGSISGTVSDMTPDPIAGVTVEAYNILGSLVGSAITNADGDYSIAGLGNGDHYVRTQNLQGYRNSLYNGLPCPASCNVLDGAAVAVSSGVDTANTDLTLDSGSTIGGTVLGEGEPDPVALASTIIEVYAESGVLAASVSADGFGAYLVEGLEAGNYHVITRVVSPDHVDEAADGSVCQGSCDPLGTPTVALGTNEDMELDFMLDIGATIYAVIGASGSPPILGQVAMIAYDESGNELKRGLSADQTTFGPGGLYNVVLTGLAKTNIYIATENNLGYQDQLYSALDCSGICDPLLGFKINLRDNPPPHITFTLKPGLSIKGHVFDSGTSQTTPSSVQFRLSNSQGSIVGATRALPDGSFSMSGLTNGDYRLRIFSGINDRNYVEQWYGGDTCTPEPCDPLSGTVIPLDGSDVTGIVIEATPGSSITGNAFDANGNQISIGDVRLYSAAGAYLKRTVLRDGVFRIRDIADGTYFLHFTSRTQGLADTLYPNIPCPGGSCDITSGDPVVVSSAGSGSGVGASLQSISVPTVKGAAATGEVIVTIVPERGYLLKGSLKDHTAESVKFTKVYLFTQQGEYAGEATTDGLGNFVSESGLPNGSYFAATSRALRPEDSPEEAAAAEAGVAVLGLSNEVYSDHACSEVCAPSQVGGNGTPIVINGADYEGIDFVLSQAAGIKLEKLTNGIHADTANGGEAPMIKVGDTVTWTYRLTNTGGANLEEILVSDNQGVTISCPRTTLAVAASMDCTASGLAEDVNHESFEGVTGNCGGKSNSSLYQNIATVTAQTTGVAPVQVEDENSSHYCNLEELIFGSGFE